MKVLKNMHCVEALTERRRKQYVAFGLVVLFGAVGQADASEKPVKKTFMQRVLPERFGGAPSTKAVAARTRVAHDKAATKIQQAYKRRKARPDVVLLNEYNRACQTLNDSTHNFKELCSRGYNANESRKRVLPQALALVKMAKKHENLLAEIKKRGLYSTPPEDLELLSVEDAELQVANVQHYIQTRVAKEARIAREAIAEEASLREAQEGDAYEELRNKNAAEVAASEKAAWEAAGGAAGEAAREAAKAAAWAKYQEEASR